MHMHDQQLNAHIARRPILPFKFHEFFPWVLTVLPFMVFSAKCTREYFRGVLDIGPALFWLGLSLAIAFSTLVLQYLHLRNGVAGVKKTIDGLKSGVNVESVRTALDIAMSVLDDPAPGRIDLARKVLTGVMAGLPERPATQSDIEQ
jgi:hypothetical protein